jgi:hypothetical protein
MSNISFNIITELHEAEAAWKLLSPNALLFDDWNFRYGYYKFFQYPLRFYTAYEANKPVGVLPLMWNEEKQYLEFFASFGYMENNSAFIKPGYEYIIPHLLEQIDRPALLEYMSPTSSILPHAENHENEYYADLIGLRHYHDFIETYMSGDKKRNILAQCRKLEQTGVVISEGTINDIKHLIYWSKIRFGRKSSFYRRPYFEEFYKFLGTSFDTRVITARINNEVQGVGLMIFYNDICFGINSGYNPEISNLGKYLSLHKIDYAIKAGKKQYAAGTGSPGWKEDFNLLKNPQYHLTVDLFQENGIQQDKTQMHLGY